MPQLVSIIIPTFNRASLIGETLDSVLAQSYSDWECIIVDDGSDDATEAIVSEYTKSDTRFQFHKRPNDRPKGANACRNYGFERSKGDLVQWFDSDDILHKDKLKIQTEQIQMSGKSISVCDFKLFRDSISDADLHNANLNPDSLKTFYQYISGHSTLNTQIVLWSRNVVENVKFDESLNRAQDLDFVYRVLSQNQRNFQVVQQTLAYIRAHSNSITNAYHQGNYASLQSELKVRNAIFNATYNDKKVPLPIRKKTFKMYLNAIRVFMLNGYFEEYYKLMRNLAARVGFIHKSVILLLMAIAALYQKTKRGLYIYAKVTNTI